MLFFTVKVTGGGGWSCSVGPTVLADSYIPLSDFSLFTTVQCRATYTHEYQKYVVSTVLLLVYEDLKKVKIKKDWSE